MEKEQPTQEQSPQKQIIQQWKEAKKETHADIKKGKLVKEINQENILNIISKYCI